MRVYKFLDKHFALKSLYEKRLRISTLDGLNDPFDLFPFDVSDPLNLTAFHAVEDKLVKTKGILCFSANWNDPVIWAHYADKHHGMCLGFDIPDDEAKKVDYVERRLQLSNPPTRGDFNKFLKTKYINWKYEEEVRMIALLKIKEDGSYFEDFGERLALREVISGARCTLSPREITRAFGTLKKEVTIKQARPALNKFAIIESGSHRLCYTPSSR